MVESNALNVGIFIKDLYEKEENDLNKSLSKVKELGFNGAYIGTATKLSPTLDEKELLYARNIAEENGVTLGMQLGLLHHSPNFKSEAFIVGNGDLREGLLKLMKASVFLGQKNLMLVIGREEDRFSQEYPWNEALESTSDLLKSIEAETKLMGVKILIKTHEEITTWEILRLFENLDTTTFRVAFDPVNSIVRMENPIDAFNRIKHLIEQIHIDDASLMWDGQGYSRVLCPITEGCIDWEYIISESKKMNKKIWFWGELHQAKLSSPFLEKDWFRFHQDNTLKEYSSWISKGNILSDVTPSSVGCMTNRRNKLTEFLVNLNT